MKYIIIIIFALSLPTTALVAASPKNESTQQTLTKKYWTKKKKTEELRKTIQQKASRQLCDPERELHMPTFY